MSWNPFGHKHKEPKEIIIVEETIILIDGERWFHHSHKHKKNVALILTTLVNNTNLKIMSLTLSSAQFSLGTLGLIDTDNQSQVAASFANVSFSGSNDAAFTVAPDASDPNSVRVTGVDEGSGTVAATADATYTDGNTGQSVTKTLSVSVDVTVIAVVVAGENVGLQLNFGEPQNQ